MTLTYLTNAGDEATPADIGPESYITDGGSGPSLVDTPVQVGAHAIFAPRKLGYANVSIRGWLWPAPVPIQHVEFWWRPEEAPVGYPPNYEWIEFIRVDQGPSPDSPWSWWPVLRIDKAGVLSLRRDANYATVLYSSSAGLITWGTWYKVGMVWNSVSDTVSLSLDDTELYSGTGNAFGPIPGFWYGNAQATFYAHGCNQYFDGIRVADAPFDVPGVAFRLAVS